MLRRLYTASPLFVNPSQPPFKLAEKPRVGAQLLQSRALGDAVSVVDGSG